jgi:DNA-binding NarL/FixJ family response regulator
MTSRYNINPVALIVNGHHAVRRALCERIAASFANFRLREAATLEDALYMLNDEYFDIVLIEGDGSGIGGLKGTRAILDRSPTTSVVVMSTFSEPTCRSAASRAGAMAFVSKRAIDSELMPVLEELLGRRQIDGSGASD